MSETRPKHSGPMSVHSKRPDEPIAVNRTPEKRAMGDVGYRIRNPDFSVLKENFPAKMRATNMARLHREFDGYGRRKTVKKEAFARIMQEWEVPDVYVWLRINTDTHFPHPDRSLQFGENLVMDALEEAYGIDQETMEEGIAEHGTLSRWLKSVCERAEDALPHTSITAPEDPLVVDLYETLLEIEPLSSEKEAKAMIVEQVSKMKEPWVFTQMLNYDFSTYIGQYMMVDAIPMAFEEFTEEEVRDAWDVTTDAPMVFLDAVVEGNLRTEIHPHCRSSPMKAKSDYDPADIPGLQSSGDWVAETKYDGTRITIHHTGDGDPRVYLGHGGKDVTAVFPEVFDSPISESLPEGSYIFDAEATPYDVETGDVLPFQHILRRISRHPGEAMEAEETPDMEVKFQFFDCLYWMGEDIRGRKYEDRRQVVENTFMPPNVARQGTNLEAVFHASLEDGHEGVVLKRKGHRFQSNHRSSDWQKWKAQPKEVDVVITDAKRGGGKFSDRVGALKIAVEHRGELVDVGSVGTGFGEEERLELWKDFEAGELVGKVAQVSFEELQSGAGDDDDVDTAWALRFPSWDALRPEPDAEPDTLWQAAQKDGLEQPFKKWLAETYPEEYDLDDADADADLEELMDRGYEA